MGKGKKSAGLRDLISFAGPHWWTIAGALALGLIGALAALAQPLLVGAVLEAVRTGGSVVPPVALLVTLFALKVPETRAAMAIAHRLSTVVEADKITLLDGGPVAAEGTHEELVAASTLYKKRGETPMIEAEGLSGPSREI